MMVDMVTPLWKELFNTEVLVGIGHGGIGQELSTKFGTIVTGTHFSSLGGTFPHGKDLMDNGFIRTGVTELNIFGVMVAIHGHTKIMNL